MSYYVLTDGHGSYIRRDNYSLKYVPVRNSTMAEKFDQRVKAANVLKNAIPKKIRSQYSILELSEGQTNEVHPSQLKELEKRQNDKNKIVKLIAARPIPNDQNDKWRSGLSDLVEFISDAETRKKELVSQLSEVDKEITDINHYIEFGKFNAYQGWLAFSMLRNSLRKRRKIKDELRVIVELGSCKITSGMLADINKAITELGNRKYVPRVLKELFE